jgi:hypothetical protein
VLHHTRLHFLVSLCLSFLMHKIEMTALLCRAVVKRKWVDASKVLRIVPGSEHEHRRFVISVTVTLSLFY